jgi:glucose-1-phosphate cytidylyltransferase
MKVVILAGGFGTRISEESATRPKPMVEIGGRPMLWHIMKIYSHFGLNDFIICLGYKGFMIKEFFANYHLATSDLRFDLRTNEREYLNSSAEPWSVTLVDTGENTLTGGRLARIRQYLDDEPFCMTYGDGVTDLDLGALVDFHRSHDGAATVTAVQPPGRFGTFTLSGDEHRIEHFKEKPAGDGAWVNGGFFVLDPRALDHIEGDATTWEQEPMQALSRNGDLFAFKHGGFWQSMDTLRDKMYLEELWQGGSPPWKIWNDQPRSGA